MGFSEFLSIVWGFPIDDIYVGNTLSEMQSNYNPAPKDQYICQSFVGQVQLWHSPFLPIPNRTFDQHFGEGFVQTVTVYASIVKQLLSRLYSIEQYFSQLEA
jgi:hypothetical protein